MVTQHRKFKWGASSLLTALLLCSSCPSSTFAAWAPVEMFAPDGAGSTPDIGADANGNAIALWIDFNQTVPVQTSRFSGGVWGPFQSLGPASLDVSGSAIAVSTGGSAIAYWDLAGFPTGEVQAAFFDGSTWGATQVVATGVTPSDVVGPIYPVAINSSGEGIVGWANLTPSPNEIQVSFFLGGVAQPPMVIGTGNTDPALAYSDNGTVVAGWLDASFNVFVNNYIGGSWQAPTMVGMTAAPFSDSNVQVGIDSQGFALVSWVDQFGNIVVSYFNGTSWQPSQTISVASGNTPYTSLAMAPNGKAIVVWDDGANNGFSSSFNGTVWSAPIQYGDNLQFPPTNRSLSSSVAMDNVGNAFVIWGSSDPDVFSATLPAGQNVWSAQTPISPLSVMLDDIVNALSNDGTGFAIWGDGGGEGGNFINGSDDPDLFSPTPTPPPAITGRVCKNRFATQTDRVKTITWLPSTSTTVVAYYLRRNGVLIASIPASGPFSYRDHKRCSHADVYSVTAVNATGAESSPLTVTIK